MAWSDAARAAAAEARRLHSSARGDRYLRHDAESIVGNTRSVPSDKTLIGAKQYRAMARRSVKKMLLTRADLARRIKAIRAGTSFPEAHERSGLQRQAVLSTHVRNMMKRKG